MHDSKQSEKRKRVILV